MDIEYEEIGHVAVCHLKGNLEHLTVATFRQAVMTLPAALPVVFDLSDVPFIDSAGLGALIGAVRRKRETGADGAVCSPRPSVKRVLDLIGLGRIVEVAPTVEAAVGSLGQKAVA